MLIKVTDAKAYNVEGVVIRGEQFVSIRQMFKKKDDKNFRPARQGVTIPLESLGKIRKALKTISEQDVDDFKEVDLS